MRRVAPAGLTLLLLSATAFAQMGGPPPGPPPHGGFGRGGPLGPGGPGMRPWKVVTDAPYSATMTEQSIETLPNGAGTIRRSTSGTVARDSSGRTYVQQTFTSGPFGSQNGPRTVIFITDPVAGYSYTLYPDKNLAIQRPFKTPPSSNRPNRTRPNDPNVTVSKATGGTYQNLNNVETTTITRTIPANTIGNSATLTSTSTVVYSPDLQIVVSSTRNDPRFGQSTYTLSNIVQGEPANISFSVPSGYTIQTASAHEHRGPFGPPQ